MNKQLEEAIKQLKEIINAKTGCDYELALFDFGEYAETVLKELERLQEENNELKFKYNTLIESKLAEQKGNEVEIQSMFVSKDKIREKIKELKEDKEIFEYDLRNMTKENYNKFVYEVYNNIEQKIKILEELLEGK